MVKNSSAILMMLATGLLLAANVLLTGCAGTATPTVSTTHNTAPSYTGSGSTTTFVPASLPALESEYKRDPNNANAAVRYSAALENAGRTRRALMVLSPFVSNGEADHNAALLTRYAAAESAMGDNDAAADAARKATVLDPDDSEASYILGRALEAGGDHLNAEIAFRKALATNSGNPGPILNDLGLNLAAQGLYDEAVDTLNQAIKAQPDQADYVRNLRIVQALQSQPGTHGTKLVPPPPPKPSAP